MSQADELLKGLTDEQRALYSGAGSGAEEPHIVIGRDRKITIPEVLKRIAVEGDHDIETLTFDCPRMWDEHDLSQMILYINYRLPGGEVGSYIAENITPVDDDTFTFTWTISRTISKSKGNIAFLVCAKKTEATYTYTRTSQQYVGDGLLFDNPIVGVTESNDDVYFVDGDYVYYHEGLCFHAKRIELTNETAHWNTELCTDAYISEGLEADPIVEEDYPDILTQLLERMTVVEGINVKKEEMDSMVTALKEYVDNAYANGLAALNEAESIKNDVQNSAAEIRNSYANAIKGNVSGEIVRVDDVSPLEHDVEVKVCGKNIIPYPYGDTTKTSNGITFTDNGDGSVTANGTATGNGVFYFINHGNNFYVDGDVCLSGCPEGGSFTGTGYSLRLNKYVNGSEVSGIVDVGNGRAGTFNNEQIRVYLVVLAGTTVENLTVRPMLEYGSVKTEYEPYIDPSTINVTRCNKNIFPLTTFTTTPSSTTINVTNNTLTLNGYLAARRVNAASLVGKTLTMSCDSTRSGEKGGGLSIEFRDAEDNRISGIYKQNELSPHFSFTVPDNTYVLVVFFYSSGNSGEIGTATYKNIQLELGDTPTIYEAYAGQNATPSTDDGICIVKSIDPSMTIFTDTPGAIVDVTYNRDTTKMFESYVLTDKAKEEISGLVKNDISAEIDSIEASLAEIIKIQEKLI